MRHAYVVCLSCLWLVGCNPLLLGPYDPAPAEPGTQEDADKCVATQLCVRGAHWDGAQCACVQDGSAASDAGKPAVCVQNQACLRAEHWDLKQCKCVPDAAPAAGMHAPPLDAGPVQCVRTQLCVRDAHWDSVQCKCVVDVVAAGASGAAGTAAGSGAAGHGNAGHGNAGSGNAGSGNAGSGGNAGHGGAGSGGARPCLQTQLCARGLHWDSARCECAQDPTAGMSGHAAVSGSGGNSGSGGAPDCVQNQACIRGAHWDSVHCRCEQDADAGPPEVCGASVCAANEHCCQEASAVDGTCTPRCGTVCRAQACKAPSEDAGAAQACTIVSDCKGLLPQLCRVCAQTQGTAQPGATTTACARWTCKNGACAVAVCE